MKKKAISAILCAAMIFGLFPRVAVAAGSAPAVIYEPVKPEYAILNRFNYDNEDYYGFYVKTMGPLYNAVNAFGLAAGATYTALNCNNAWTGFMNTNIKEIAAAGQLKAGISATLKNLKHTHAPLNKSVAYQFISMTSGYNTPQTLNGYDFITAGTATQRLGDRQYNMTLSGGSEPHIQAGVGHTLSGCSCGDCTVGDIAVAFADTVDPGIKKVYACNKDGVAVSRFTLGPDFYLRVVFNEPIRFADNVNTHGDVKITAADGGNVFTGTLAALQGDSLLFKFAGTPTTPASPATSNFVLSSVNLSSLLVRTPLFQIKAGGVSFTVAVMGTEDSNDGYDTSAALITDIAGNPLAIPSSSVAISSACYIDGETPYVAGIKKTAQMNNGDVKTALQKTNPSAFDYLDQSDTRAGAGDHITFTATFNEQLAFNGNCYESTYFLAMKATLNVKDSGGNPVTVRSASMRQVSGGLNLNNGASRGNVTEITFEPFAVAAGMTCDDPEGKIRVIAVTPFVDTIKVNDLCGNSYDGAGGVETARNENPFILDVIPPAVAVNTAAGASEEGGAYTPVTEAQRGALITAFRLPLTITDSSGTDGLQGGFSWINREIGGAEYSFDYAVTAASAAPASDSTNWMPGVTGASYSFTQAGVGTYIHIRLTDGITYDLTDTAIRVTAKDYAGNSGTATFVLRYAADGAAPVAALTGTERNAAAGKLTAGVTVTDKVGIRHIDYLWVTDGSVPTAETSGWTAAGDFIDGAKTAAVSVERTGITAGNPFAGVLYIKAEDTAGNRSVTGLGTLAYDISAPAHTLTYTEEKTAQAELFVSGLAADSSVAVMVKKPDATDIYYVSVISSATYNDDVLDNQGYNSQGGAYNWHKYRVEKSGGVYTFSYLGDYDVWDNDDKFLSWAVQGFYYGPLDVTVLSGNTLAYTYLTGTTLHKLDTAGTASYPVYAETFTLNAAPETIYRFAENGAVFIDKAVYSAEITCGDTLGNRILSQNAIPGDSKDYIRSTLEGVKFTIELSNQLVSAWGISDVDFDHTYLRVIRVFDENGVGTAGQVIVDVPLAPQAAQTIALPALTYPDGSPKAYPSGSYKFVLTVTARASGKVQTFDYPGTGGSFCVDATTPSENFGFAAVMTREYNARCAIDEKAYTYYGPVYGAKDADGKPYTAYSAGDQTVYIPVNNTGTQLYFTVDDIAVTGGTGHSYYGVRAMKAWNVTEGVDAAASKAASPWLAYADTKNPYNVSDSFYAAAFVSDAGGVVSAYGDSGKKLPLIKDTLNTVAYQVMNANGLGSEVRYAYIYPVDAAVSGSAAFPDTAVFIREGALTFTPAAGQSMFGVEVYAHVVDYDGDGYQSGEATHNFTDTYDLAGNTYSCALTGGVHAGYVYTRDAYGNYTFFDILNATGGIDSYFGRMDRGAPVVSGTPAATAQDAGFTATVTFIEDTAFLNKADQKLSLYFDGEYMKQLGLSADSGESFHLTLPVKGADFTTPVWTAAAANKYGITGVDVLRNDTKVTVTIRGVIRYDGALPGGAPVSHTLYATLEDPFGNVSSPAGIAVEAQNTKPAYISGEYQEYSTGGGSASYRGLVATFNTPVMTGKSIATDAPSPYGAVKTSELPVFGDGTHTISFYDIFGTKWTQEITLNNVFGEYSLQVSISDTGYTAEPVEVTVTADHPGVTSFVVYNVTAGWVDATGGNAFYTTNARFTISENSEMRIVLFNTRESVRVHEMLYVVNILPEAPAATLSWYFDEFKASAPPSGVTETSGNVTVWYNTPREVTPTGGTTSSHTFIYGDGVTAYTFRYVDEAGNLGSVTADLSALGLTLTEPPSPPADTTAPEYQLFISDGLRQIGYFSSVSSTDTLPAVVSTAGYVQKYSFEIGVTEDSPYKLFLLSGAVTDLSGVSYGGASAAVDGVTLSGRTVTVTKAAVFTIAIVDSAGNKKAFSLDLGAYFDNTAPTAVIEKVYDTLYQVTAYVQIADLCDAGTETGTAAILSPEGFKKITDSSSAHNGWYYCSFTDNRTVTVTVRDGAGNKGKSAFVIDSLDMTAPVGTVVWSPYFYNVSSNRYNVGLPPNHPTNTDVVATVSYNKPIRTISAVFTVAYKNDWADVTGSACDNLFTLTLGYDTARVSFHEGNYWVKLTATALNGQTVTTELYLDNAIDRTPPVVTQLIDYHYHAGYTSGTPYSATITLTPDEEVYCSGYGKAGTVYDWDDELSFTVYEKGTYLYHFMDLAGNVKTVAVEIDRELDRTAPEITVIRGDDAATNTGVDVGVSMDEAGTITLNGVDHPVEKGQVVTVNIENNGSYGVTAVDRAGNRSTTAFVVGVIDKIAPTLIFSPYSISVRQDSDSVSLAAALNAGYTAADNRSEAPAIRVTWDAAGVDLTRVGVYTVTYTAKDEVGNEGTGIRYVKVYSKYELEVLLNGVKTENGGTTVLSSTNLSISVANPAGNEPYTIYLRSGLKTAGQMKKGYAIITPGAGGGFTVPAAGFYTLYIVTQSRQTYLTKIYIGL